MLRWTSVIALCACWTEDGDVCTFVPSQYAEDTYEQTCEGVTKTFVSTGCNGDDDWFSGAECRNACPTPATCVLTSSALAGGTCTARTCGH